MPTTLISADWSKAWLENWQANKDKAWPHLVETYGAENAQVWYNRWIAYHASLTEFFAVGEGHEYGVSHMLFQKKLPLEAS